MYTFVVLEDVQVKHQGQSLPALNRPTPTRSQSQETPQKSNLETPVPANENFLNFEAIRNSRLQKSPASHRAPFSTSRGSVRDSPIKESEEGEVKENKENPKTSERNVKRTYELPKSLKKEFGYLSDDEKSKNDRESFEQMDDSVDLITRSRLLHARLVQLKNYI